MESAVKSCVINYANATDITIEPLKQNIVRDYIPFGSDNLFPQAIARISRTSPNHRGVINSKTTFMIGGGLVSDAYPELITKANANKQTLSKVTKNLIFDDNTSGNAYCEIITDSKKSFIYFNHLDFTKCRISKDEKYVIMHPDWRKYESTKQYATSLPLYPNFEYVTSENGAKLLRSVYHFKDYEPEFTYYGIPLWIAGKDSAEIDLKTNKWNLSRLENSFRLSGIMVVPVSDAAEAKAVITNIENNYTGEGNQNKLLVIAKTRAKENEKADTTQLIETKQDDDGSWINLHNQSLSDIMISHGWYRSLTSLPDNTGFDTNRILNEYKMALATSIVEKQNMYLDFYKEVYKTLKNIDVDFRFINKPPMDDYQYHYIYEARERLGLDFDKTKVEQNTIIL